MPTLQKVLLVVLVWTVWGVVAFLLWDFRGTSLMKTFLDWLGSPAVLMLVGLLVSFALGLTAWIWRQPTRSEPRQRPEATLDPRNYRYIKTDIRKARDDVVTYNEVIQVAFRSFIKHSPPELLDQKGWDTRHITIEQKAKIADRLAIAIQKLNGKLTEPNKKLSKAVDRHLAANEELIHYLKAFGNPTQIKQEYAKDLREAREFLKATTQVINALTMLSDQLAESARRFIRVEREV